MATIETNLIKVDTSPAEAFLDIWKSGISDADAEAKLENILSSCELSGRMIHGFPSDPGLGKLLSAYEWKRISWVFGPYSLREFLGQSPRGICLTLGFGKDWLDGKLRQGMLFKLCIFPSKSVSATKATWKGVQQILEDYYPQVWPKIAQHYEEISKLSIEEIQGQASYDMEKANFAGRDHVTGESESEYYMSLQRLKCIDSPSLVQVRQFLWDELALNNLFRGDGFTYDDNGCQGKQEYIAKQMLLKDIEGASSIDVIPTGDDNSKIEGRGSVGNGS
eukprot:CAMPEP_0198255908 /NCGR_PEP_ID=MMETSP1447-20131203/5934_1 /TAXON_ID=420782 /ORGANISM="Chaetoceros dichaeta, Strain CCMP1751" /LENGTH=277 /DNA_ID=CAMNT_0043942407 /DNA_START=113 /DNA_END=946 /DNA_ORIENTATION=+